MFVSKWYLCNGWRIIIPDIQITSFWMVSFFWIKKDEIVGCKSKRGRFGISSTLLENGKIRPIIDRKYSLDKTSDAMNYLSLGHSTGKVLITL